MYDRYYQGRTRSHPIRERMTESHGAGKLARRVCAMRRFEIFLPQAGGTGEEFLSYQLTWRRKPKGTRAC
jgi:hypothetical protein